MFKAINISKKFKEDFWKPEFEALKDVSFELHAGEIVGFLGANGAGKTTFLKILLGFISPSSGSISYSDLFGPSEQRFKKIGYMPERPYYYQYLTGREFLLYCGELHGISVDKIDESILKWAQELKLEHALDRQVKSYSKGMLQRLGFISCLIHNPELIILDEPLSGLDPIGRKEFKDIMRSLKKEGKTIFFSSHIVSDVEEVCEKVVILEDGKILYSGNIDKLIHDNEGKSAVISVQGSPEIPSQYRNNVIEKKDEATILKCSKSDVNNIVKDLIDCNLTISKIDSEHMSLEEIVYRIRGEHE
jgi:ABC-2 type transport system ATP-binding protein